MTKTPLDIFTKREREVLKLLCEKSLPTKQIARLLSIANCTVSIHRQNIFRKTNLTSIQELCSWYYTNILNQPKPSKVFTYVFMYNTTYYMLTSTNKDLAKEKLANLLTRDITGCIDNIVKHPMYLEVYSKIKALDYLPKDVLALKFDTDLSKISKK
jgi:DNA-binding CsgD family transcriptional regulator